MPLFSAFTPFGALAFSSAPSRVQTIYDANIANLNSEPNENFDLSPPATPGAGTNIEAMVYARSRCQAAARYVLDRAYNNANPAKATDSLPLLEQEYQIVPGSDEGLPERRATLAARFLLPKGAGFANVVTALTTLLGSDFVYYRVTKPGEVINFPATGGDSPGNFVVPTTIIKMMRLNQDISISMGVPQSVAYIPFDANQPALVNGDIVVVDPETEGLTERVTVSSVTEFNFTATFNKAHSFGRIVTTTPYPYWKSNQRHVIVVVTRACAEDPEKRRKIDELMARIARGVTSWDIIPESAPGSGATAAFKVGDAVLGRVGYAGITSVTYP